jgi:hypothetical protein
MLVAEPARNDTPADTAEIGSYRLEGMYSAVSRFESDEEKASINRGLP